MKLNFGPAPVEFSWFGSKRKHVGLAGKDVGTPLEEKKQFLGMLRRKPAEAGGIQDDGQKLASIQRQSDFAKQRLPWPAGGQVDADATSGFSDASANLK